MLLEVENNVLHIKIKSEAIKLQAREFILGSNFLVFSTEVFSDIAPN